MSDDDLPLLGLPVPDGTGAARAPRRWPALIRIPRRPVRSHPLRPASVRQPWGRMCVWRAGGGAPLLAVHGLGGSGRYWQGLVGALDGGAEVLAPDLCGFGRSDKPDLRYDLDLHVDALDAAVDAWGATEPITVVGHSIGGIVAAAWAARRVDRVARLVLACTPYPGSRPDQGRSGRAPEQPRHAPPLAEMAQRGIRAVWPALALVARTDRFPYEVIRDYQEHTMQSYWGTAMELLYWTDLAPRVIGLREAPCPRLLLCGRDDQRVRPAEVRRWRDVLGATDPTIVPGGHQLLLATRFAPLLPLLGLASALG